MAWQHLLFAYLDKLEQSGKRYPSNHSVYWTFQCYTEANKQPQPGFPGAAESN